MSFRWFTYYTDHPRYKDAALALCEKAKSYGMGIEAVPIFNTGDWMKNCLSRSIHLRSIQMAHPEDWVGLLDSDVDILKKPDLLMNPFDGDILVDERLWMKPDRRYLCGILCFAPTDGGNRTLARWADLCQRDSAFDSIDVEFLLREQLYLDIAVGNEVPAIHPLPKEYTMMTVPWVERDLTDYVCAHRYDPCKPPDLDKRKSVPSNSPM
jgi:hypothetical protein